MFVCLFFHLTLDLKGHSVELNVLPRFMTFDITSENRGTANVFFLPFVFWFFKVNTINTFDRKEEEHLTET